MGDLANLTPWGAVASAGSDIVGGIIQNQANRKLASAGQAFELEMWNKSNEYNSPQAQMARLKQAGLNPNLVYGSGNVSGQSSAPPPKAHIPEYKTPMPDSNLAFNMLNTMLDVIKTQSGAAKTGQDIEKLKMENQILKDYSEWHPGQLKANMLINQASLLDAESRHKIENLFPYQKSKMEIDIDRMRNAYDIEKNRKTVSDIDTRVAQNLEDFKTTNPYLGMLLSVLGSFSGLNLMSGTPLGKKSSPGVTNNRTVNVYGNKPFPKTFKK